MGPNPRHVLVVYLAAILGATLAAIAVARSLTAREERLATEARLRLAVLEVELEQIRGIISQEQAGPTAAPAPAPRPTLAVIPKQPATWAPAGRPTVTLTQRELDELRRAAIERAVADNAAAAATQRAEEAAELARDSQVEQVGQRQLEYQQAAREQWIRYARAARAHQRRAATRSRLAAQYGRARTGAAAAVSAYFARTGY